MDRDWENGYQLLGWEDNPFAALSGRVEVAAYRVAENGNITGTDPESRAVLYELRSAVRHADSELERVRQVMRSALKVVLEEQRQKRDASPPPPSLPQTSSPG